MPAIIGIIVIILVSVVFLGPSNLKRELFPERYETGQQTVQTLPPPGKSGKEEKIETFGQSPIDTFIVSGPEGEVLEKTNKVTFEFRGISRKEGTISFETKIEGLDSDWQHTYSNQRTIDFPATDREYTFLVRAKTRAALTEDYLIDQTPATRKFRFKISPYFGKVRISSVSHSSIILNSSFGTDEKNNITNWWVEGKKGQIIIPKAVELFVPGSSISESDIFLKKYEQVYLQTGSNPFGGKLSFRPNKCFGYLASSYGYPPPFSYSKICPRIKDEEISNFSDDCQNFVRGLESCTALDYSNNPVSYDSNCVFFINNYIAENLNYEGCIDNYFKDKDFYQNSWYIFAGYDILGKQKDIIYLYDNNGLLVDKYYY